MHAKALFIRAKQRLHRRRQRARDFSIIGNGRSVKLAWAAQDLNPAGAAGNAAAATADKGRAVLEASGRALAELLAEFDSLPAF